MMMSMSKVLTDKHVPEKRASSAGLRLFLLLLVLALAGCYPAPYREVSRPMPVDAGGGPRAPITQVYFYPKAGQTTEQQSRDHYECYSWAVKQTGFDPSQSSVPLEQRVRVVPMPPPGYDTAVLAITGAVLGALIGGPRHAGAGALIGAGTGAIVGAASDSSRQQTARQLEEAYSNRDRSLDAQYEGRALNFRRAMSACLEGRGYTVQ
ncbi:MAG: YMGG-like glycine zipper-containing protein [Deltaproteobacteria bacterium]|nr:YMGG-like glycine zipper-containing protein [Deltaproteobacteria bacterium]